MAASDEQLRPADRLKTRAHFKRTAQRGQRRTGQYLIVYGAKNSLERSRLGLTVSRKVGGAVRRNRWKRRLREIFRRNKPQIHSGWDFVIIVRKTAPHDVTFEELRDEMLELMNAASQRA